MDFLPVFLDISNRKILIDGGGTIAARRAQRALKAKANVFVFNEELSDEFIPLLKNKHLTHIKHAPKKSDFEDCYIVYGASENEKRDEFLYKNGHRVGALVNIADEPKYCDFITPSIVDRSPLIIAITSSGKAPVIARILRARLEALIPPTYGRLVAFLGGFRPLIGSKIKGDANKRYFWENIIEGLVANKFLAGDKDKAKEFLHQEIDIATKQAGEVKTGEVYLVGAGPGDPDLLTFRALRLMQRCDVVLYDRLVSDDILTLVRRDAKRINVGKLPKNHTMEQGDISQLMVDLAKEGKRVLRLKGGDPFLFGRGGEEIEMLSENDIIFQIVPAVTAAIGCSAYAGIPLTHRDYSQSCLFITAHGKDGALDLDWDAMLRPMQTIAIYMGLSNIKKLAQGFLEHGADINMPAALIEKGTMPEQKVIIGTVGNLDKKAKEANIKGPAIIIIGDVVKLHKKLKWVTPDQDADYIMSLSAQETF
jgi:uroporphyrin-III C-methyltransferase/precorrin-2 dehydrogenase/sirohydrochlorin ferrochelatase